LTIFYCRFTKLYIFLVVEFVIVMAVYKLQEIEDQNGNVRYQITVNKELVNQLDWEKGDEISQDLQIAGRGAGRIKLEKVDEDEE